MVKKEKYPTTEQLRALKRAGWTKLHGGLFWQAPPDPTGKAYYFSPRGAVAKQELLERLNAERRNTEG